MHFTLTKKAYNLPDNHTDALSEGDRRLLYDDAAVVPAYAYDPVDHLWDSIPWKDYEKQFQLLCKKLETIAKDDALYTTTNQSLLAKVAPYKLGYGSSIRTLSVEVRFHGMKNPMSQYASVSAKPQFFAEFKYALEVIVLDLMRKLEKIKQGRADETDKVDALTRLHGVVQEASVCHEGAHSKFMSMKAEIEQKKTIKGWVGQKLNATFEEIGADHCKKAFKQLELDLMDFGVTRSQIDGYMKNWKTHPLRRTQANDDEVTIKNLLEDWWNLLVCEIHAPDFFKNLAYMKGRISKEAGFVPYRLAPALRVVNENGVDIIRLVNSGDNGLMLYDVDVQEFEQKFDQLFNELTVSEFISDNLFTEIVTPHRNVARKDLSDPVKLREHMNGLSDTLSETMGNLGLNYQSGFFDHEVYYYDGQPMSVSQYQAAIETLEINGEDFDDKKLRTVLQLKSELEVNYCCAVLALRSLANSGLGTGISRKKIGKAGIFKVDALSQTWFENENHELIYPDHAVSQWTENELERFMHSHIGFEFQNTLMMSLRKSNKYEKLLRNCETYRENTKFLYNLHEIGKGNPHFAFDSIKDLDHLMREVEQYNNELLPVLAHTLQASSRRGMNTLFATAISNTQNPHHRLLAKYVLNKLDAIKNNLAVENPCPSSRIYLSFDLIEACFKLSPEDARDTLPHGWFGNLSWQLPEHFFAMRDYASVVNLKPNELSNKNLIEKYPPLIRSWLSSVPYADQNNLIFLIFVMLEALIRQGERENLIKELIGLSALQMKGFITNFYRLDMFLTRLDSLQALYKSQAKANIDHLKIFEVKLEEIVTNTGSNFSETEFIAYLRSKIGQEGESLSEGMIRFINQENELKRIVFSPETLSDFCHDKRIFNLAIADDPKLLQALLDPKRGETEVAESVSWGFEFINACDTASEVLVSALAPWVRSFETIYAYMEQKTCKRNTISFLNTLSKRFLETQTLSNFIDDLCYSKNRRHFRVAVDLISFLLQIKECELTTNRELYVLLTKLDNDATLRLTLLRHLKSFKVRVDWIESTFDTLIPQVVEELLPLFRQRTETPTQILKAWGVIKSDSASIDAFFPENQEPILTLYWLRVFVSKPWADHQLIKTLSYGPSNSLFIEINFPGLQKFQWVEGSDFCLLPPSKIEAIEGRDTSPHFTLGLFYAMYSKRMSSRSHLVKTLRELKFRSNRVDIHLSTNTEIASFLLEDLDDLEALINDATSFEIIHQKFHSIIAHNSIFPAIEKIKNLISDGLRYKQSRAKANAILMKLTEDGNPSHPYLTEEFIMQLVTMVNIEEAKMQVPVNFSKSPVIQQNFPGFRHYAVIEDENNTTLRDLVKITPMMIIKYLTDVPEEKLDHAFKVAFLFGGYWCHRSVVRTAVYELLRTYLTSTERIRRIRYYAVCWSGFDASTIASLAFENANNDNLLFEEDPGELYKIITSIEDKEKKEAVISRIMQWLKTYPVTASKARLFQFYPEYHLNVSGLNEIRLQWIDRWMNTGSRAEQKALNWFFSAHLSELIFDKTPLVPDKYNKDFLKIYIKIKLKCNPLPQMEMISLTDPNHRLACFYDKDKDLYIDWEVSRKDNDSSWDILIHTQGSTRKVYSSNPYFIDNSMKNLYYDARISTKKFIKNYLEKLDTVLAENPQLLYQQAFTQRILTHAKKRNLKRNIEEQGYLITTFYPAIIKAYQRIVKRDDFISNEFLMLLSICPEFSFQSSLVAFHRLMGFPVTVNNGNRPDVLEATPENIVLFSDLFKKFINADNIETVLVEVDIGFWPLIMRNALQLPACVSDFDFTFLANPWQSQSNSTAIFNSYKPGKSFTDKLTEILESSASPPIMMAELQWLCDTQVVNPHELPVIKKLFAQHIAKYYRAGKVGEAFMNDPVNKAIFSVANYK